MAKLPDPWRTLTARIRALEEQVRRQRNASPFAASGLAVIDEDQIANEGSQVIPEDGVLLVDGGDVKMLDKAPSAQVLFSLGQQEHGDRGVTFNRDDGSVAIEIRKVFGPTDNVQKLVVRDRSGAQIFGDSTLSPSGFDAPHMSMPFIPVDYTSSSTAQTTSSASFVATHEHRGFRQNPAVKPQFMVKCSDGSTAAEVQVYDVVNATYLGGFLGVPVTHTITVPAGTTTFTLFEFSGALQLGGTMSADLHLQIHARVTAGAGSVSVAPVRTVGSSF